MRSSTPTLPYLPALDGVRALAVIAVLACSFGLRWAPGGFVGVEVFFVLSGWLISTLLVAEQRDEGAIDVAAFWVRRARRLLPAATLALLTTLVVAGMANDSRLGSLRIDSAGAMAGVLNWRLAFGLGQPFASPHPSPLQHLWVLAIEQQFYVVFPLILGTTMFVRRGADRVAPTVLGIAATLTLWRVVMMQAGADVARIYYGTDTRVAGLVAGIGLGMVWTPRRLRPIPTVWARPVLAVLGGTAIALIAWYAMSVSLRDPAALGLPLAGAQIAAVILVAVVVHPSGSLLAAGLSISPLRWIGQRSYSLYLWHWPVAVAFARTPVAVADSAVRTVFVVGLTFACAALSYRFVEEPIRRRGLRGALRRLRAHVVVNLTGRPALAGAVTALMVVGFVGSLLVTVHAAIAPVPEDGTDAAAATDALTGDHGAGSSRQMAQPELTTTTSSPIGLHQVAPTSAPPRPAASAPPPMTDPPAKPRKVVAIGDSIMMSAAQSLGARVPGITVDAENSRQGGDAVGRLRQLDESGQLGDVVVLHVGTNGPFSPTVIDDVVDIVGKRRVVLVNNKVPRPWEEQVNRTLADAVDQHRNVRLLDWNDVASTEPGLLTADGYHLTSAGVERYATLIARAVL